MDTRHTGTFPSIGLLILRLGMGGFMLTHGWGKFLMLYAGQGAAFADPIGLGPTVSLTLTVFAEFLCALLVMAGLLTRLAAIPIVFTMAVAAFVVHANDPLLMEHAIMSFMAGDAQHPGNKQGALLYLFPFLALVFTGPGRFSLDAILLRRRAAKQANAPAK